MKDVKATELPRCDVCRKPGCGVYNTPTKALGPCGGRWANMCGPCFDDYGLDTSMTERRVLPAPVPHEVRVIADRWGGEGCEVAVIDRETWGFEGDGFHYAVYAPRSVFALFENSGAPAGRISLENEWAVRCINDAPDALWTVTTAGEYRGYRETEQLWKPEEATIG